jgi:predicted  nucleic acid-binding Zn-ribbon protein
MDRTAEQNRKAAQELKNNQDFINTTNQWLQKLSVGLDALRKDFEATSSQVDSKQKYQDINIEKINEKFVLHQKSCNNALDAFSEKLQSGINSYKLSEKNCFDSFSSLEFATKSLSFLNDRVNRLENEIKRIERLTVAESVRLSNFIENKTKNIKEEIQSIPSEIPGLKSMIEEKVAIFNVNFEGTLREIELVKKDAFISKKYIENLYTQLDRLKQGAK